MSTQIFLHIEIAGNQIKGEATTAGYEGEIEVESFSWGMSAKNSPRVDQQTSSSRTNYDCLSISKLYDKASINLTRYMTQRTPFDHVQLTVDQHQHAGGKKKENPVMVIDLADGFIEDVKLSMSEAGKSAMIKEDITLSFRKADITYFPASPDRSKRMPGVSFNVILPAINK